MKKSILSVAIAVLGFAAISCKKTVSCYCTDGSRPTVKANTTTEAITKCETESNTTRSCTY